MALRLIHVGIGGWGGDWAVNAVPRVPTIERVAAVDADPAALAKGRKRAGIPEEQCFTSLGEAMDKVSADAVLVTATVGAHVPLAVEALHAGKHVLVEKPFAPTVAEAHEVLAAADEAGRTVMVSQNYRFFPAARTAARLVADQALGRLGTVHIDFRKWANSAPEAGHRHYRLVHPLLYDMAIHHFDLMRMVLGQEPVSVYTQVSDPPWSRFKEEASAVLTVTFDGGSVVSYRGSWVSSGEPTAWSGAWHLECEDGEIYWTGRDGPAGSAEGDDIRVTRRGDEGPVAEPVTMLDVPYIGRAGSLAEFARAVEAGEEPESSGRRNVASLALAEAAARSVVSGQVEKVTWGQD
ncbi:Gfo/Idh/MocA family oxidoreductase [Actinopolymorpha rutila]|uniref:Putative dehydrogenase n=1 Tax=Actinopolymorpha rutila TaxID=446787 RepID=A0A852ZED5_9ACTN|nr:putative dehydrogenase [Actinopolymorpha rutila]